MSSKSKNYGVTPLCIDCDYSLRLYKGIIKKKLTSVICSAQGYRNTAIAYNTNECRMLFKKIEEVKENVTI